MKQMHFQEVLSMFESASLFLFSVYLLMLISLGYGILLMLIELTLGSSFGCWFDLVFHSRGTDNVIDDMFPFFNVLSLNE